jgi:hypothetical protein
MARKKIKLEEEAISEILVADTPLELSAEATMKTSLRKNKKRNDDSKPQQKSP